MTLLDQLISILQRITDRKLITVIELLLIGAVVFSVLNFLRGTRGARLIRAVGILLAVSFAVVRLAAEELELDRIKVLYPYFVLCIFLVSLVAFQTELRRLLLRLGEISWLRWWDRDAESTIDPVVDAVMNLSRKKVGALLAIVRNTQIGAIIETGIPVDANISSELLESIFWPGSPLHDLATIIQHGRIVASNCQLPLAESGEVDRSLGSRHRAAVGLSHESDAVVIVVSEETGIISLAIHGKLRRAFTADSLKDALKKELLEYGGKVAPTSAAA